MTKYIIHPIPQLAMEIDLSMMTHLQNYGKKVKMVTYVWYLEGGPQKILVDAGASIELINAREKREIQVIQSLEDGLGKYGLKPEDIDIILLTHLHHDHIAQAAIFKNATFIVQKAELEGARSLNSHPIFMNAFPPDIIKMMMPETVEGDVEVADGIKLLYTPGHTAGNQSVAVNTDKGLAIISGGCSVQANFEPPPEVRSRMPVIAPAVHLNVIDAYDSFLRIKEYADIVIPLHDPKYITMISATE